MNKSRMPSLTKENRNFVEFYTTNIIRTLTEIGISQNHWHIIFCKEMNKFRD